MKTLVTLPWALLCATCLGWLVIDVCFFLLCTCFGWLICWYWCLLFCCVLPNIIFSFSAACCLSRIYGHWWLFICCVLPLDIFCCLLPSLNQHLQVQIKLLTSPAPIFSLTLLCLSLVGHWCLFFFCCVPVLDGWSADIDVCFSAVCYPTLYLAFLLRAACLGFMVIDDCLSAVCYLLIYSAACYPRWTNICRSISSCVDVTCSDLFFGPNVDKAPRPSISNFIWVLSSDNIYQRCLPKCASVFLTALFFLRRQRPATS